MTSLFIFTHLELKCSISFNVFFKTPIKNLHLTATGSRTQKRLRTSVIGKPLSPLSFWELLESLFSWARGGEPGASRLSRSSNVTLWSSKVALDLP